MKICESVFENISKSQNTEKVKVIRMLAMGMLGLLIAGSASVELSFLCIGSENQCSTYDDLVGQAGFKFWSCGTQSQVNDALSGDNSNALLVWAFSPNYAVDLSKLPDKTDRVILLMNFGFDLSQTLLEDFKGPLVKWISEAAKGVRDGNFSIRRHVLDIPKFPSDQSRDAKLLANQPTFGTSSPSSADLSKKAFLVEVVGAWNIYGDYKVSTFVDAAMSFNGTGSIECKNYWFVTGFSFTMPSQITTENLLIFQVELSAINFGYWLRSGGYSYCTCTDAKNGFSVPYERVTGRVYFIIITVELTKKGITEINVYIGSASGFVSHKGITVSIMGSDPNGQVPSFQGILTVPSVNVVIDNNWPTGLTTEFLTIQSEDTGTIKVEKPGHVSVKTEEVDSSGLFVSEQKSEEDNKKDEKSLSGGETAAIVIAVILVVGAGVGIGIFLWYRRTYKKKEGKSSSSSSSSSSDKEGKAVVRPNYQQPAQNYEQYPNQG